MISAIDSIRQNLKDGRPEAIANQPKSIQFEKILRTAQRPDPAKMAVSDPSGRHAARSVAPDRRVAGQKAVAKPVSESRPNTIPTHVPATQAQQPSIRPRAAAPREVGEEPVRKESPLTAQAAAPADPGAVPPEQGENAAIAGESIAAGEDGKTPRKGADEEPRAVALNEAELEPISADDMAGAMALPGGFMMDPTKPLPGTVLTSQDIIEQARQRSFKRRSIDAQVGLVAYRTNPHGLGEEQHAAAAGLAQPDEQAIFKGPGAPRGAKDAVTEFSKLQSPEVKEAVLVVDAVSMVELSKRQHQDNQAASQPDPAEAPEDSAQARNQVLNQIGGFAQRSTLNPNLQANSLAAAAGTADRSAEARTAKAIDAKSADGRADGMFTAGTPAAPQGLGVNGARGTDPAMAPDKDAEPGAARLMDKVVQEARWMIRSNQQEVTMRLEPEHLGHIKLKVRQSGGDMTVEMTVDNAAAKNLLDANILELRQRLQHEHLGGNGQVQVDIRHGRDSETGNPFAQSGPGTASAASARNDLQDETARVARDTSNMSIYA